MELIYLWVEEYKNIRKQGFNFSGRYRCEYDEEKNELTINENKEYVHIFPDNINVTAIVGENGSGKSSILEAIAQIQSNSFNEISGFLLFDCDNKLYIIDRKQIRYDKKKIKPFTPFDLDGKSPIVKSKFITLWMDALNSYAIKNSAVLQLILQGSSLFYEFNQNDIKNKHYELSQEINLSKILEEEYYFDSFKITLKNISVEYEKYWKEYSSSENKELLKIINNIHLRTLKNNDFRFVIAHNYYIASIRFYLKHWQNAINIPNCNFSDLFTSFISNINSNLNITAEELISLTRDFNLKVQRLLDKDSNFLPSVNTLVRNHTFLSIILKNITLDYSKKESNIIYSKFYKIYKFSSDEIIKDLLDSIKHFTELEEDWLEFNFFDIDIINQANGNKYSTLSDGERQLLNISLDLLYSLKNSKDYGMNQLIIFDEADSFLHPKWSKTIIYKIKKLIENYNNLVKNHTNLHLLFSTHSPFILSDFPKENVIFLKDGKQVKVDIDTFGANIHTLLSHGFFMEDGLMGEYAKSKINKAIELLNKQGKLSRSSMKYCEEIISIIGEPILKKQLQRMLDSKRLSKIDEIDLLKTQMSEIQQKIKKLEGGK